MHKLSWIRRDRDGSGFLMQDSSTDSAITKIEKSYQRSTISSTNRSIPDQPPVPASNKRMALALSLLYEGGRLVQNTDFDSANFMKPTQASYCKAVPKSSLRRGGWNAWNNCPADWQTNSLWLSNDFSEAVEHAEDEVEKSIEVSQVCTRCDGIESANADTSDDSLKSRSRLDDDRFYSTPASTCFIPFGVQMRFLRAALRLAKETLWCALREHWPHIQRSHYLEGPEEVKFGREELNGCFGNEEYPSQANELRCQPRGYVICHVLDVVYLRNAVCHPGHHTTKEVDKLISRAQGLAVVLQDEQRAFKIRRLRDELQTEAVKAYDEIETYVGLASLPFAKPWPLHHQRFFDSVRLDRMLYNATEYPEVVLRAAREWQLMYCRPGELDPRYLSNVERAKSFMRSTDYGRCASMSAMTENRSGSTKLVAPEVQSRKMGKASK